MNAIEFFVPGKPVPGGSKRAFLIHRKGCPAGRRGASKGVCICNPHTSVVDAAGRANKDWRSSVVQFAYEACRELPATILPLWSGAIKFYAEFWLPRPKGHYAKSGLLSPSAPTYHIIRPDVLKLARAVEDALTGIIWTDDSVIVRENLSKEYSGYHHAPGVNIRVELLEEFQSVLEFKNQKTNERGIRRYTLQDPTKSDLPPSI